MSAKRELRTAEVAKLAGIKAPLLRRWKYRGLLPSAPQGVSGQGRSVECLWSDEAVQEVLRVKSTRRVSASTREKSNE